MSDDAMPEMVDVYSTAVSSIGYDEGKQTLYVTWARTGRMSVYRGVPAELATQIRNAPSVGQALRESVQGTYDHQYI